MTAAQTTPPNRNNTDADTTGTPDATEDQIVHVQLRPGTELLRKCLAHLERTLGNHPNVGLSIAGFNREEHQFLLTLAVNLGPKDRIAKFSDEAVTGYNFVSALFTEMFDYLPQYTGEPTAIERENAAILPSLIAADTHASESAATAAL